MASAALSSASAAQPVFPVRERGLIIAFQPIVDMIGGRIYAYEAVLRGPDGETPDRIFAMLDPGARSDLDRRFAAASVRWAMAAGLGDTTARLSIPIHSPADSSDGEPAETALREGQRCGLIPERMIFAVHDYQDMPGTRLADMVDRHARMGSTTSFVGLGPDHAGLGTCARYLPNAVKLEGELIRGIASSWSRRLILEELTPRVRKLGIKLLAGDVDSEAVLGRLRTAGIYHVQGDHVARPQIGALPPSQLKRAA